MGVGSLFSLLGCELGGTCVGKLPGIFLEPARPLTCRTLDWPGEAPNSEDWVSVNLMVWSLRNVNVPGREGGPETARHDGLSTNRFKGERSGYKEWLVLDWARTSSSAG